jgi:hypothetical protein
MIGRVPAGTGPCSRACRCGPSRRVPIPVPGAYLPGVVVLPVVLPLVLDVLAVGGLDLAM